MTQHKGQGAGSTSGVCTQGEAPEAASTPEAGNARVNIRVGIGAFIALTLGGIATAQVTSLVSHDYAGTQPNGGSTSVSISDDGRYVSFASGASNLVPADTNGFTDVFVYDRHTGTTTRASVDSSGGQANQQSFWTSLSEDGRYVAFWSHATTLVAGDTNGARDIFVHDRQTATTTRVSVDSSGVQANGMCDSPEISADGRFVAFESLATNVVAGDTNGAEDVFVHDRQTGITTRVSVDSSGIEGNDSSFRAAISGDGRFVAFWSDTSNLVVGDTNGVQDVFVHDRQTGTTSRASVDSSGVQGNHRSGQPAISGDGREIAFWSIASNLVAGDTNGSDDVFVHDQQTGITTRVNVSSSGGQANNQSLSPSISADGRFVTFQSTASNLVAGTTGVPIHAFVHDRQTGATTLASINTMGEPGNANTFGPMPISAGGRYIAFSSQSDNLVAGDLFPNSDVFVLDRTIPGFQSLCHPGVDGVAACPCANPPAGPGRGCDNSFLTGGAALSALGAPYLGDDSLVFLSSGEPPTATSVLLQGTVSLPNGLVFGQGVRCAGGTLLRLYIKPASNGETMAPNFGAGDRTVSAQSAFLGDAIRPGESRFYLIYYRDAVGAAGCAPPGTFNSTQTGQIVWSAF